MVASWARPSSSRCRSVVPQVQGRWLPVPLPPGRSRSSSAKPLNFPRSRRLWPMQVSDPRRSASFRRLVPEVGGAVTQSDVPGADFSLDTGELGDHPVCLPLEQRISRARLDQGKTGSVLPRWWRAFERKGSWVSSGRNSLHTKASYVPDNQKHAGFHHVRGGVFPKNRKTSGGRDYLVWRPNRSISTGSRMRWELCPWAARTMARPNRPGVVIRPGSSRESSGSTGLSEV